MGLTSYLLRGNIPVRTMEGKQGSEGRQSIPKQGGETMVAMATTTATATATVIWTISKVKTKDNKEVRTHYFENMDEGLIKLLERKGIISKLPKKLRTNTLVVVDKTAALINRVLIDNGVQVEIKEVEE